MKKIKGLVLSFVCLFGAQMLWGASSPDWNLSDAYRASTATREKICLNGIWRIRLSESMQFDKAPGTPTGRVPKPGFMSKAKSADVRVPGEWFGDAWYNRTNGECMMPVGAPPEFKPHICSEVNWDGKPLKNYFYAAYEREFVLPENWKPGEAFLRFEQVNVEAWVFINSKFVGYQKGLEAKDIPLPADIKPGQNVKLTVMASAFVTGTVESISTPEVVIRRQRSSNSRGIVGDIWLVRHDPAQEKIIKDIFVAPSVRNKNIKVRVEFPQDKPSGKLDITIASVKTGAVLKTFSAKINSGKSLGGGIYEYTFPWANPVLWSPDNPCLYKLNLSWSDDKNNLVDAGWPVQFGFREAWVQGTRYYLNRQPYCLKIRICAPLPNEESAEYIYKHSMESNYNCLEMGCGGNNYMDIEASLRKADELGMLMIIILPSAGELRNTWTKPGVKEDYQKELALFVKKIRNHPSVVLWSMNFNLLGYPLDLNPHMIGTNYLPPENILEFKTKRVIWKDTEAMVDELDGSRPKLQHAGGNHGDISTSNIYLNFPPKQEKDDWLLHFSKNAVKPFIAIELGRPAELTYFHARLDHGFVLASEPLYAEYGAMFLGPEAYAMETFARMKTVVDSPVERKAIEDGSDKYADMHKYYYYVSETEGRPFGQVLPSQAFMGDFMKYWRAWGISGMDPYESVDRRLNLNYVPADGPAQYASFKTPGIKTMLRYKPKYSARTILFDKYREWLDPELFFIGGGKKEKFTDKQHAYRGKAIISKSIVWVNDRFEPKSEKMKVELRDASGAPVQQKELDIKAKPGDIQFIEFTLNAPDVAQKTPYTVVLSRKINGQFVEKDKLDMQVHPVDPAGAIAAVKQTRKTWLIDTKGLTKKTLQALKIKFGDPALSSAKLGSGDLLIVGRESISELYKKVPDIAALVKNGLNVLVFEQTKPDLEKYCKLYAVEASARHVFLPISGNPVTKGLSQEDLADWTGEGTLLEAFPVPTKEAYGEHPFKNGNRGMVASVVIEKPHRGAFLHLLHQGFDLAYTPLMEEKIGKGMILYCQLDVTGRTADSPVIELITKNIIDYADKRAAAKETAIVYAGGAHGKDILESSGADFTVAGDLGSAAQDASKDAVLVLGEDGLFNFVTKNRQQLTAHLSKGGTVLLLAVKNPVELARMLGANIIGHSMEGYWFYPKQGETAGMSAGMSAGDFYWKDNFSLPLPDKQYPLYSQNIGPNGGRLIICQIDPLYFTNKEINQRRYRGRYKMNRQVAIVLANLGAQFKGNTPQYMDGIEKQQEIDLAGAWNFKIDLNDKGESEGWYKTEWKDGFKKMNVPGSWESQNELTPNPNVDGKQPYDGYAWYQKTVVIPSSLKGIPLFLEMGNVDDMDWSYFNGQPIGKTGKETKNYYSAKRYYPIPENLIQFDKPNTVTVRCFDEYQEGGLMKGPDKIAFKKPEAFFYLPSDDYAKARFDPYKFYRW